MYNVEKSELVQKSQVVPEEQADVQNATFPHCKAFDAETERPGDIFFAVYSNGIKNIQINHAAAAHFRPAFFADPIH